MQQTRALIARHPALLAALLACTLLVRMLVPAGFMPVASAGTIRLVLCSGVMPAAPAHDMRGMHHGGDGKADHSRAEQPCAFAGLSLPTLGSADPALLLATIAFAFLLVLLGRPALLPAPPGRLRPPLRAPPRPV